MASLWGEMRTTRVSATSGKEVKARAKMGRLRCSRNCFRRDDCMRRQPRRIAPRRQRRIGLVAVAQGVFKNRRKSRSCRGHEAEMFFASKSRLLTEESLG